MNTWKKTQSRPVATLKEGAIVAKFDDFQFDLETGRIFGYRLKGQGVFSRSGGVAAANLSLIGNDLVFIRQESDIEWTSEKRNPEDGRAWASQWCGKTRVITRRGANLGEIEDLVIEAAPPKVLALILDNSRMLKMGDGKVTIGRDAVVIEDPTAVLPMPDDETQEDWWDKVKDVFSRDDSK